jgi:16S rRNA (uracil1498-N3)-methyltransferase
MNLLLLRANELDEQGRAWVDGARAEHLVRVLGVQVGQTLRSGRLDLELGRAQVLAVEPGRVHLEYTAGAPLTASRERCLLLAIPRPKVLSRCLEHASALGFARIVLIRSARVEKSHLQSHKLSARDIEPHLIAGLEQGMRVTLPDVHVFDRFKPFVEDRLNDVVLSQHRFVAHLHCDTALGELPRFDGDYCVAIGPEGGWVPFEVNALRAQGFTAVRAAMGPLRVESALSYLTGQLDLIQRRAVATEAPPASANAPA